MRALLTDLLMDLLEPGAGIGGRQCGHGARHTAGHRGIIMRNRLNFCWPVPNLSPTSLLMIIELIGYLFWPYKIVLIWNWRCNKFQNCQIDIFLPDRNFTSFFHQRKKRCRISIRDTEPEVYPILPKSLFWPFDNISNWFYFIHFGSKLPVFFCSSKISSFVCK